MKKMLMILAVLCMVMGASAQLAIPPQNDLIVVYPGGLIQYHLGLDRDVKLNALLQAFEEDTITDFEKAELQIMIEGIALDLQLGRETFRSLAILHKYNISIQVD